ncbi:hypothetical protein [Paenibacillus sp. MBLB4367]|uniref:hypothetical protein n=1 Tax=Paenibacillus sp. MBLB4367 TaxID=3384767 RepID=UPI0039083111
MKRSEMKLERFSARRTAGAMAAMLALSPAAGAVQASAAEVTNTFGPGTIISAKGKTPLEISLDTYFYDSSNRPFAYSLFDDAGNLLTSDWLGISTTVTGSAYLYVKPDVNPGVRPGQYRIMGKTSVSEATYSEFFSVKTAASPVKVNDVPEYNVRSGAALSIPLDGVFADEDDEYITPYISSVSGYGSAGVISSYSMSSSDSHIGLPRLNVSLWDGVSGTATVTLGARDNDYRGDTPFGSTEAASAEVKIVVTANQEPVRTDAVFPDLIVDSFGFAMPLDMSDYFTDFDIGPGQNQGDKLSYRLELGENGDKATIDYNEEKHMLYIEPKKAASSIPVTVRAWDDRGVYAPDITFNLTIEPSIGLGGEGVPIKGKGEVLEFHIVPETGDSVTANVYLGTSAVAKGQVGPSPYATYEITKDNETGWWPDYITLPAEIPDGEYLLYTLGEDGKVNSISEAFLIADLVALLERLDQYETGVEGELIKDGLIRINDIAKFGNLPLSDKDITKDGVYDRRDMRYLLPWIGYPANYDPEGEGEGPAGV